MVVQWKNFKSRTCKNIEEKNELKIFMFPSYSHYSHKPNKKVVNVVEGKIETWDSHKHPLN
jgi:hypothetical protein